MSLQSGTWSDLIHASTSVGTAATGAANGEKVLNDTAGMGVQAVLLSNFWQQRKDAIAKGFHVIARGIWTTTTTAQTLQLTLRGTTTAQQTTGGSVLLQNAAITPGNSLTTMSWEMEGDVVLTTIGAAGANSTAQGVGQLRFQNAALASGFAPLQFAPLYGAGASPGTVATVDTSQPLYLNLNAIFAGTVSASNTIQLQQLLVFGH